MSGFRDSLARLRLWLWWRAAPLRRRHVVEWDSSLGLWYVGLYAYRWPIGQGLGDSVHVATRGAFGQLMTNCNLIEWRLDGRTHRELPAWMGVEQEGTA